jgi:hypothetical protein
MLSFLSKSVLFIGFSSILSCSTGNTPVKSEAHDTQTDVQAVHDTTEKRIFISAVGDCMIGTNYPSANLLPPNDGKDIFRDAAPYLQKSDLAFGNCEGGFLTGEGPVKKCSDPTKCYAFKMPDHYINHFVNAGFDILSIANNHVGDFGEVGRINTKKVLTAAGMYYAGLTSCPTTTFEKDGVKYGFCAFAPNNGTVNVNDLTNAKKIVQDLDKICDVVIVSIHAGGEGSGFRHLTNSNESYLGEKRGNPQEFAKAVIDVGADIVFGHGPHVPRAMDLYKGKFIAYSLGNFATYARFSLKGQAGFAPLVTIEVNRKGDFIAGEIISFIQEGEGGPSLDAQGRVAKDIKDLTEADCPTTKLSIDSTGKISIKN